MQDAGTRLAGTFRVPVLMLFLLLVLAADFPRARAQTPQGTVDPAATPDQALPVLQWKFASTRGLGDDRQEIILFHRVLDVLRSTPADEILWEQTLNDLAHLLDRPRDLHIELEVERSGPPRPVFPGEPRQVRAASLWTTVDQLIGELPPAGRREWVKLRSDTADAQLKSAIASSKLSGLRTVARRFVHTPAGYEAVERVGTHHLDRNAMVLAVRQFEKLRRSPEARQSREPMLTLKASAGWAALGRKDRAFELLVELDGWLDQHPRIDRGRFALLDEPLEKRLRLLQTLAVQTVDVGPRNRVWTHFLGTPQRTAQAEASPVGAMLWESWTSGLDARPSDADRAKFTPQAVLDAGERDKEVFPATESEQVAFVESGMQWLDGYDIRNEQWHLPASYPVIADGIAIFRTFNLVRAVELATGDIRWEIFGLDPAWEEQFDLATAESATRLPKQQVHLFSPLNQRQSEFVRIRTRYDRTTGTMSTDGRYLFFIEHCGIPSTATSNAMQNHMNRTGPLAYNKLLCAEIESGFLEWEIGGPHSPKPLPAAEYFFLGPPTVVDGKAYVLGELSSQVRLFCLEPKTGEIVWSQDIANTHLSTNRHGLRRTVGASPTEASGLLICPLVDGSVVAVDPDLRSTAWTWRYSSRMPTPARQFQRRGFIRAGGLTPHVPSGERWRDLAVMNAGGLIVLTSPDADLLFCVDVVTGRPLWSVPRNKGLYLATVYQDSVVVVDSDGVRSLSLVDGTDLWRLDFDQRRPCGRGLRTEHVLHLPVRTVPVTVSRSSSGGVGPMTDVFRTIPSRGMIASIDLRHGRLLVETETPDGRPAGNLVAANGMLVSQQYGRVTAMPALRDIEESLAARAQNPDEATAALTELARLRLHQGQVDEAIRHLKSVVAQNPKAIPSELVLRAVMLEIQSSGRPESELLDLFESVPLTPADQLALSRVRIDLLVDGGKLVAAFNLLVRTPVSQDGGPIMIPGLNMTQAGPQWRATRLADLYSQMTAEQRLAVSGFEPDFTQKRSMRDWLSMFGSISGAAPAVRLRLAAALDPQADLLEIESLMSAAIAESGDVAAEIARNDLWLKAGQGETALVAADEFRRRWSGQSPRGKTVDEIADKWKQHEAIQKLPQPVQWPLSATVRVDRKTPYSAPPPAFVMPAVGVASHAVDGWLFALTPTGVQARDPAGRVRWTIAPDQFPHIEYPQLNRRPAASVASDGHLLVVMLGTGFSVFDVSGAAPKRLWSRSLLDATATALPSIRQLHPGLNPGRRIPAMFLSSSRLVGIIDELTAGCLVYRTLNTLHCVDAVTGSLLWRRSGTRVSTRVFSDGRHLTIADYDGLQVQSLMVLDLQSGRVVRDATAPAVGDNGPLKDFQLWDHAGRNLIGRRRAVINAPVESYDPFTGKQVWSHRLTTQDGGFWIPVGRNLLVGLDSAGHLKVCDMTTGRLLVDTQVPATPSLQSLAAHETEFGLVLFAPTKFERLKVSTTFRSAIHAAFVGGLAHGIDVDAGKVLWTSELPQQFVTLPQPRDLPVIALRSRRSETNSARGPTRTVDYPVDILDVRSGQVVKTLPEKTQVPDSLPVVDFERHEIGFELHGGRTAVVDFRTTTTTEPENQRE